MLKNAKNKTMIAISCGALQLFGTAGYAASADRSNITYNEVEITYVGNVKGKSDELKMEKVYVDKTEEFMKGDNNCSHGSLLLQKDRDYYNLYARVPNVSVIDFSGDEFLQRGILASYNPTAAYSWITRVVCLPASMIKKYLVNAKEVELGLLSIDKNKFANEFEKYGIKRATNFSTLLNNVNSFYLFPIEKISVRFEE